jgi:hypothetical protein
MSKQSKETLIAVSLLMVFFAGHILTPFNVDNDLYQAMGFQLMRFHRLPYLGSFDMNFPGIIYFHAGIISLFGNSEIAFRLVETLLHVFSGVLVFLLIRRWVSKRAALLSVLMVAIWYNFDLILGGQRDGLALFFILLTIYRLYRFKDKHALHSSGALLLALLMGLLMGIAMIIRPTNGLFAIMLLVALNAVIEKKKYLISVTYLGMILFVWLVAFSPYLFSKEALERVYLCLVRFTTDTYSASNNRPSVLRFMLKGHELFLNIILLGTLGYLYWTWKDSFRLHAHGRYLGLLSNFDWMMIVGFYLCARIPIWLMGKGSYYHYEAIMTISFVPISIFIDRLALRIRNPFVAWFAPMVLVVAMGCITYPWNDLFHVANGMLQRKKDPITYSHLEDVQNPRDSLLLSNYWLVQYLEQPSNKNGRFECEGLFASIYWRTEREPASAFTLISPLVMESSNGLTTYQYEWIDEFVDSLRVVRPEFIILSNSHRGVGDLFPRSPYDAVHRFPGFNQLIETDYRLDTTIYSWVVYRRKT